MKTLAQPSAGMEEVSCFLMSGCATWIVALPLMRLISGTSSAGLEHFKPLHSAAEELTTALRRNVGWFDNHLPATPNAIAP